MLNKTVNTADKRQFRTPKQLKLEQHSELRKLFLEKVKFEVNTILVTPFIHFAYLVNH